MSRSVVIVTCDCGCNRTARPHELERWLVLTQYEEHSRTAEPKIGRDGGFNDGNEELHFASFDCLLIWVKKAIRIIPSMTKSALMIHPRGGYYSVEFPTLWF